MCDNAYDAASGAGTCDTMIAAGYSCAVAFCASCGEHTRLQPTALAAA